MIRENVSHRGMKLFASGLENGPWEWLCGYDKPWEILSRESDKSLFNVILSLADNEFPHQEMLEDFNSDQGPIFIHEKAKIGTNVRFEGPVYIEEGAEVRHGAYLRPGTYVSRGCVVGHCTEVKNTLMLPYSKAPHFNYVGDSILGSEVNLGAGAKISNVRLDRRNVLIQLPNGNKIDSGLRKIGALIGDKTEVGCNVVTNPGSVILPNSAIPPNYVVTGLWRD